MSVGRICTRQVDLADAEETAWQAAERMHQRTVGTLVVLNASREPVGIVTDRDLVVRVMAPGRDPQTTPVGDIMTRGPETVTEETSLEDALLCMRRSACRRLLVVDRRGKFVGLLSLDDVLMLLSEEMQQIGKLLESETPQSAGQPV